MSETKDNPFYGEMVSIEQANEYVGVISELYYNKLITEKEFHDTLKTVPYYSHVKVRV